MLFLFSGNLRYELDVAVDSFSSSRKSKFLIARSSEVLLASSFERRCRTGVESVQVRMNRFTARFSGVTSHRYGPPGVYGEVQMNTTELEVSEETVRGGTMAKLCCWLWC